MTWDAELTGEERRAIASQQKHIDIDPRDALRDYTSRGWHIFPVLGNSKRPLVHWPTAATTDPGQIHDWYVTYRGCGWAVNVGKSQLWVVDCDSWIGREQWHAHAIKHKDNSPWTTTVARTGGGGWHHYYHDPFAQGVQSVRRFGDSFDTRAAGGYVVLPPTRHASGKCYEWLRGPSLLERIPQWVTEEWHPMGRRPPFTGLWTCGRGEGMVQKLLKSSGEERQKLLMRAAMHVGRQAAKGELETQILGDLANCAITRGVPHEEAYQIAKQGFKAAKELR